jgi:glycosyltransferase involved in cell wall biosynthesis
LKIGLFHGYELTGSGSNEYTRYLARSIHSDGHEVHVICRETNPDKLPFFNKVFKWSAQGEKGVLKNSSKDTVNCVLHILPESEIYPVYVTDKQRGSKARAFINLTDGELEDYLQFYEKVLETILREVQLDILHCNHLVYQPIIAQNPCLNTGTPFIIFPHGSSIEYTIRPDKRFYNQAIKALEKCNGLIIGNEEVRDRITTLYPEHKKMILDKTKIVGVGVDTSLFCPVKYCDRPSSIDKLISEKLKQGKSPEQSCELREKLSLGDWNSLAEYRNAYNEYAPDSNIKDKLKSVNWDQKVMIFVGALTAGKGLQTLITAMPEILNKRANTQLIIVGSGAYREVLEGLVYAIENGDLKLLDYLVENGFDLDRGELKGPWNDVKTYLADPKNRKTILENGQKVKDRIHFTGRLGHDHLQHLFPCADLAIFPSVVPEAYPLVLMESLANGVLPMVSYFSGFKDGIDELKDKITENIWKYMKFPMEADKRVPVLIKNITHILGDKNLAKTKDGLHSIAVKNYDWKLIASQMVKEYKTFQPAN